MDKQRVIVHKAVHLGPDAIASEVAFLGTYATQWPFEAGAPTVGFVQARPLPDIEPLRSFISLAASLMGAECPGCSQSPTKAGEHGPHKCWYKDDVDRAWECFRALANYEP